MESSTSTPFRWSSKLWAVRTDVTDPVRQRHTGLCRRRRSWCRGVLEAPGDGPERVCSTSDSGDSSGADQGLCPVSRRPRHSTSEARYRPGRVQNTQIRPASWTKSSFGSWPRLCHVSAVYRSGLVGVRHGTAKGPGLKWVRLRSHRRRYFVPIVARAGCY